MIEPQDIALLRFETSAGPREDDPDRVQWDIVMPGGGDTVAQMSEHLTDEEQEHYAKLLCGEVAQEGVTSILREEGSDGETDFVVHNLPEGVSLWLEIGTITLRIRKDGACLAVSAHETGEEDCIEIDEMFPEFPEASQLYIVDGHEFENPESNLAGDGQFPPFRVFDPAKQDYVGPEYATREEAQAAADIGNAGSR